MEGRSEGPEFSNPPLIAAYFISVDPCPKANTVYIVRFWKPAMLSYPIVGALRRSVMCMKRATSSSPASSPWVVEPPLPEHADRLRSSAGKDQPVPRCPVSSGPCSETHFRTGGQMLWGLPSRQGSPRSGGG